MFNKIVLIFALLAILTGCDQQQNMMKLVMDDVLADETAVEDTSTVSVAEDTVPVEEPIIYFPTEIDGIVQEHKQEVFTSANAAINSERFHNLLEIAKAYNLEYCGISLKPSWLNDVSKFNGNPQDQNPEKFHFLTEAAAKEFEEIIKTQYADDLGNSRTVIPERYGWWGSIDIKPRCGF